MSSPSTGPDAAPVRRVVKIFASHRFRSNSGGAADGSVVVTTRPFPSPDLSTDDVNPFLRLELCGPLTPSPEALEKDDTVVLREPWHPYRGFDRFDYVLQGSTHYQDSMGTMGRLEHGDVLLVRTGNGIVMDERCVAESSPKDQVGTALAFERVRLWANVPSVLKMANPEYHLLTANMLPLAPYALLDSHKTRVKLLCGALQVEGDASQEAHFSPLTGAASRYGCATDSIVDVRIDPSGHCVIPVSGDAETALVVVLDGAARVYNGGRDTAGAIARRHDCVLYAREAGYIKLRALELDEYKHHHHTDECGDGDAAASSRGEIESTPFAGVHCLVLVGRRINEPVAAHGPFVLNDDEALRQAFQDFQDGQLARSKPQEYRY